MQAAICSAHSNGVFECADREPGFATSRHGLADDPVGEDVFDGAQVEDAFTVLVLSDVGEPQFVCSPSRRTGDGSDPFSSVTAHRSSCTGGPGRPFLLRFFPNTLRYAFSEASFHALRSDIGSPRALASSAENRYPNSGSSTCASNRAFAQYA